MITLWVKSRATTRPRRTHRWRYGEANTVCGIPCWQMVPVTSKWGRWPHPVSTAWNAVPKPCHVCFKHLYRLWSMGRF